MKVLKEWGIRGVSRLTNISTHREGDHLHAPGPAPLCPGPLWTSPMCLFPYPSSRPQVYNKKTNFKGFPEFFEPSWQIVKPKKRAVRTVIVACPSEARVRTWDWQLVSEVGGGGPCGTEPVSCGI